MGKAPETSREQGTGTESRRSNEQDERTRGQDEVSRRKDIDNAVRRSREPLSEEIGQDPDDGVGTRGEP